MRNIQYLLLVLLLFVSSGVVILHAQEDCNIDTAEILTVVEDVCAGIGENQVCYGNFDVGADILDGMVDNLIDFTFDSPGDFADLANIESLYLSALNPEEDTWGIAQMRLVTPSKSGTQELNLLLFGDVEIENAVASTVVIEVQVSAGSASIRNLPSSDAIVLKSLSTGRLLEAIGRIEDNSWLRVRTETGNIAWIASELISPTHEGENLDDLEIQDNSSSHFGSMQAFYFEQGSGSACDNVTADGLLVQTPQGTARVNVSINGVNIQLVPGQTGTTALIQDNENSEMTISVIEGDSIVESGGVQYNLVPGERTNITIGGNGTPNSQPSIPTTYNNNDVNNIPTLSLVTTADPLAPITNSGSRNTTSNSTTNNSGTSNATSNSTTNNSNSDTTNSAAEAEDNNEDSYLIGIVIAIIVVIALVVLIIDIFAMRR